MIKAPSALELIRNTAFRIGMIQIPVEVKRLLIRLLNSRLVCEISTARSGLLYCIGTQSHPLAHLISIDIERKTLITLV